ncbi:MAG TPA: M28 family metallopeptidase [Steroidobacteraceae bacterium]|jgi:hypothetical protein|nr:M28 family metallopeptidase [Steroidobacteraceae bacterium]
MSVLKTGQIAALIFAFLLSRAVAAQTAGLDTPADPRISMALKEISAEHVHATIAKLVSFGTRSTLSAQDPASIAAGRGIGAAREWLKSEFERYSKECGGCLEVKVDAFIQPAVERVKEPTPLTNIYAVLKGTDPSPHIVLVTGHYDSRNSDNFNVSRDAPGANDDASGTAVSLECARVLSKLKFRQTIIFLTVPGEEQGLLGSKHLAQIARQEGWPLDAVLNNDIVGGNKGPDQDAQVVRVFSEGVPRQIDEQHLRAIEALGGENDSTSRELARYVAATADTYRTSVKPLMIFRLDRFLRGGDHASFNEQGFSAVRFTEYREDFTRQHQDIRVENGINYGDTLDHVDFDYVANVARVNAATLASIASAPVAPTNVKIELTNLDNDSALSWDASPGASDYEVLWRATSSPQWEHAQKLGALTRTTLKISKDNVIFAVRALDKAGHASLPVVPVPPPRGR